MTIIALESLTFGLNRLADAAQKFGEDVCLLTRDKSIYSYELSCNLDNKISVIELDTFNLDEIKKAISGIKNVSGLINTTDTWSLVSLDVARDFDFHCQNPDSIRLVRNKHKLRNHLFDNGLSQGQSLCIDPNNVEIEVVRTQVSYPIIVKDTAGTGSQYVWMAEDDKDLHQILNDAKTVTLKGLLTIEPYFMGTLYSIEAVSWRGETKFLALSSRILSSEPDFMEEAISAPVQLPDEAINNLQEWIGNVLTAVGYTDGFSHTEFIMTKERFEVVEINPRLGGVQIGEALCQIYDLNIYDAFIEMALGLRPELMNKKLIPKKGMAQVFVYAKEKGKFESISGLSKLPSLPGEPTFYPTAFNGKRIENLKDQRACVGILVASGVNSEVALQNVLSASSKLKVNINERS